MQETRRENAVNKENYKEFKKITNYCRTPSELSEFQKYFTKPKEKLHRYKEIPENTHSTLLNHKTSWNVRKVHQIIAKLKTIS